MKAPPDAGALLRARVQAARQAGDARALGRSAGALAQVLASQPARLAEALALAEQALALLQAVDPLGDEAWAACAALGDVLAAVARAPGFAPDEVQALQQRARACREVAGAAPRLAQALARLPEDAAFARGLVSARLARCFELVGRADLARTLAAKAEDEAPAAAAANPSPGPGDAGGPWEDTEERHWFFEPDLLLDAPAGPAAAAPATVRPLGPTERPALAPDVQVTPLADGALRWRRRLLPQFERHPGCTAMRRVQRALSWPRAAAWWWPVVEGLDGQHDVQELLQRLPATLHDEASRGLATLAAAGMLDLSGRALARHLHALTRKGSLTGGLPEGDDVMRIATDGAYRRPPARRTQPVAAAVPEALAPLHALTRARRSRREFDGRPVPLAELEAVLHTACGVTGRLPWQGRTLPLRAYPSSGALYAVEIYPLAWRVHGLEPGVWQYRPEQSSLALLHAGLDAARMAEAALPMERAMVRGAAAMVALTGHFRRHERKYGPGGYRMLVAEAGHVSQNLVLAATALGLAARPFGGVFDALLDELLGLEGDDEQFLLGVLIGRA